MTLDTVWWETPASRATSNMEGRLDRDLPSLPAGM